MPIITSYEGPTDPNTANEDSSLPTTSYDSGYTVAIPEKKEVPIKQEQSASQSEPETGFFEYVGAAIKVDHSAFQLLKKWDSESLDDTPEEGFNAVEAIRAERPDLAEEFEQNFIGVPNRANFDRKVFNIDYELEQREKMANASMFTQIIGGMVAGSLDPLNALYALPGLKIASIGLRVATTAAAGGALGAGIAGTREYIKSQTKEVWYEDEAKLNIMAETAFGTIAGGIVGALAKPISQAARVQLRAAMNGSEGLKFKIGADGRPEGVVRDPNVVTKDKAYSKLDEEGLAYLNKNFVKVITGPEFMRAPELRAIMSESQTVQKFGDSLYRGNYIKEKHLDGIASDVKAQNLIFRNDNQTNLFLKEVDATYLKLIGKTKTQALLTGTPDNFTIKHMDDRIWRAVTNKNYKDEFPEINGIADKMRNVMDTRAKELVDEGLLPPEMLVNNYLPRRWNVDKLSSLKDQEVLSSKISNWLMDNNPNGTPREVPIDSSEATRIADSFIEGVRGEDAQKVVLDSIMDDFISKGTFLKDRHLMIPDELVQDYLEHDAAKQFKMYMQKTSRLLETTKAFKRNGNNSFEEVKAAIHAEGKELKKALAPDDRAGAIAIDKKFGKNGSEIELATMMYKSALGQLRKPGSADRYFEALLNYQYMRLLGGVTLSSISEVGMIPLKLGIRNTFEDGLMPMLRSFKDSAITKDQWTDFIGAAELEQSNILGALGGLDDMQNVVSGNSKMERYLFDPLRAGTKAFSKATLIPYWTNGVRRIATQVTVADLTRTFLTANKTGKISKDLVAKLASMGIGKKDYKAITRQLKKYSQERNGTYIVNPHLWDDKEALKIFGNGVQNQVESTIMIPGIESQPFFAQQSNLGKLLWQFKSFATAATGKVTVSSLQKRDMNTVISLMYMTMMGSMTGMASRALYGQDQLEDWDEILVDGITRAGYTGLIGTTAIQIGRTYMNEDSRRYGFKSIESMAFGPSFSQLEEIGKMQNRITKEGWTDTDTRAAASFLPFANLFYVKSLFNQVFDEGLSKKDKKSKKKPKTTTTKKDK